MKAKVVGIFVVIAISVAIAFVLTQGSDNRVQVRSNVIYIKGDVTLSESITIDYNHIAIVVPGSRIRFKHGAMIQLRGGYLSIDGSETNPVYLLGASTDQSCALIMGYGDVRIEHTMVSDVTALSNRSVESDSGVAVILVSQGSLLINSVEFRRCFVPSMVVAKCEDVYIRNISVVDSQTTNYIVDCSAERAVRQPILTGLVVDGVMSKHSTKLVCGIEELTGINIEDSASAFTIVAKSISNSDISGGIIVAESISNSSIRHAIVCFQYASACNFMYSVFEESNLVFLNDEHWFFDCHDCRLVLTMNDLLRKEVIFTSKAFTGSSSLVVTGCDSSFADIAKDRMSAKGEGYVNKDVWSVFRRAIRVSESEYMMDAKR